MKNGESSIKTHNYTAVLFYELKEAAAANRGSPYSKTDISEKGI